MHISIKDRLLIVFQYIIPHRMLNSLAAKLANSKNIRIKNFLIKAFIKKFDIDLSEYIIESPEQFTSFNDFFHKKAQTRSKKI